MSTNRSSSRLRPGHGRAGVLAVTVLVLLASACGSEKVVKDGALAKDKGVPTIPIASTVTTLPSVKGKACQQATGVPAYAGKPAVLMPVGKPPTKLSTADIKVGTGTEAKAGDTITVNYIGIACSNGKQFDTSWAKGRTPFTTSLSAPTASGGGVIDGWVKGIAGMKVGGRRQLVIPPDLAYGSTGNTGIAPDETLVFVVDLLKVEPPSATTTTAAAPGTTVAASTTTAAAGSSTTAAPSTTVAAATTTTKG